MTIKEVERETGLTRSNIRFYEREGLLRPSRNDRNGYREYSEGDVEEIKKIAYLRSLGISLEEIRRVQAGETPLVDVVRERAEALREEEAALNRARAMCERMLKAGGMSYEGLRAEEYAGDLEAYWGGCRSVLRLDSVRFLAVWGSDITWAVLTLACLAVGLAFYGGLPEEIPVQWERGEAVSFVGKGFIFVYPLACVGIRFLLRPVIYMKWLAKLPYGELAREYLSNYFCFVALSVEVFSVLFVYGWVKNVAAILLVDSVVLVGVLIVGMRKKTVGSW